MNTDFDAVIIGSGIGGLTCGAFLTQSGMRVLVLEKHTQIGGYTHSFKRRQFIFESAVHSVPAGPDGLIFHLLRKLGLENSVKTIEHRSMYHSKWQDFSYSVPVWCNDIIQKIGDDFPGQKTNFINMLDDMKEFYYSFLSPVKSDSLEETPGYKAFISKYMNRSFRDYVESFLSDERLRRVFYSQWPFGGSPPSHAPVAFYVLMFVVHAMEGSHYIEGGFSKLASALASVIKSGGGEVRTRSAVTALRTKENRASELLLENGETISARLFVSNISPYLLHREIIDPQARSKIWLRRLNNLNPSVSSTAVYLGLNSDISEIIPDNISFWFGNNDNDIYDGILNNRSQQIDHLIFLQHPSTAVEKTITILNFVKQSYSADWKQEKKKHAENMLSKAEELYPGLRERISLTEIGSPGTFERYTGNTGGALYGFENTSHIYGEAKLPVKTYLSNLFQTGHWGKPGGGVWNAMYNGYTVAGAILLDT